jgi:leader peptidase (prepilin peptidase)/N-methyltransferase
MKTAADTHATRTAGFTVCIGGCVAAVGLWQTGLLAAIPAATGLTVLAASDLATRRFSLTILRVASGLVIAALLIDTARHTAWHQLAIAATVTTLAAAALAGVWLGTRGIAFGDVLLTSFAVAVPAWLSPRAAVVTLLVGVVAAALFVLGRRVCAEGGATGTVAFGPALLAGWVVAMVVG